MAAIAGSLSFAALGQCCERRGVPSSAKSLGSNSDGFMFRASVLFDYAGVRASNSSSRAVVRCMCSATDVPPTVAETKSNFLAAYKRPILSIYNTVLQELLVQQHLTRYKKFYQYDPVFALGFVTVYDRLMEGYPSDEDRETIFKAYIQALNEDPEQYRRPIFNALASLIRMKIKLCRVDALKLEEWVRSQNANSLIEFSAKGGEVEEMLKGIAERAGGKGSFSYSRFFAVGLFRLLELANATDPTVLYKLCAALNVNKRSVDRDLDVYRNLLSKLVQAKELLKEYIDREKKKREERASESQKANEAIIKCLGEYHTVMQ